MTILEYELAEEVARDNKAQADYLLASQCAKGRISFKNVQHLPVWMTMGDYW